MPYLSEKIKLVGTKLDRRRKLSEADRRQIRALYGTPGWSQRKIAKHFGVSRRLVIFIGCPAKHEQNLRARDERGGSKAYYTKEKHREYMKSHRHYKQGLLLTGKAKL